MDCPANADDLLVRPMEPDDALAVSRLIGQLGYERTPRQVLESISALGPGDRQAAFVACIDNDVVGWIEVSIEQRLQSAPFALIGGLVVNDAVRGRRIGRRLCQRAETWSWERSVHKLRVTSRSTRGDAHRFYVRDGYRMVKTSLIFEKDRPH